MPSRDPHLQFERWAREYGPVYSLMLGTKCLIVLSSDEAVRELLDKRSAIYSHRQEMYIGQTLCSGDLRFLMMVCSHNFKSVSLITQGLIHYRSMGQSGVGYVFKRYFKSSLANGEISSAR